MTGHEGANMVETEADLEAVLLAEAFSLLAAVIGPYTYTVSGRRGQQQALFANADAYTLFYIRVNEFLAERELRGALAAARPSVSLLSGLEWLASRYAGEAKVAGLDQACHQARDWVTATHHIVFWAPSIWRHVRLSLPARTMIAMRANFEKHHVMRLDQELTRLRRKCAAAGCPLSVAETLGVRAEFDDHLKGMLEYHATRVVELLGRLLLSQWNFVRRRYEQNPTNNLDLIAGSAQYSHEVFRYMYGSTVLGLAQWSEERITSCIPETAPSLLGTYPQHKPWDDVASEWGAT